MPSVRQTAAEAVGDVVVKIINGLVHADHSVECRLLADVREHVPLGVNP